MRPEALPSPESPNREAVRQPNRALRFSELSNPRQKLVRLTELERAAEQAKSPGR